VHPLQVLDEELPATNHDFQLDLIATPEEIIACDSPRRRAGILWDELPSHHRSAIPVLASLSSPPTER
jgi:5-formyltetrahydrofolate cyclo-ligase